MKTNARWQGYKNRAAGEFGEGLVKARLMLMGLKMVERVHTPFKVLRGPTGRVVNAFPVEKVSGDFRAVVHFTGRSVLVEVKTSDDNSLPWSKFQPHQITALDENRKANGLSLIAWVKSGIVYICEWPIPDFKPRASLKISEDQIVSF